MLHRILLASGLATAAALAVAVPASAATVPAKPASCSVERVADGYRVAWSPPANDGGAAVTKFRVREQGYTNPVVTVAGSVRAATWTNRLRDGADVRFVIRAVNSRGASSPCVTAAASAAEPVPVVPPTPPAGPTEPSAPPVVDTQNDLLPYSATSFFKSRIDTAPVDAGRTASFRSFMRTHPDQGGKGITWPKINMNPEWAMSYHVGRDDDPVWRLRGGNTDNPRLRILTTQGFHMADAVADTFPTGDQDRPGVMIDSEFGYTVQFADAVPDKSTRTITVSNAGIMWHSSNGLDYRNPQSDDDRNLTSRGRILDAMVLRRDALDRAVAHGTGLGHVLHLFFVETDEAARFVHPMVGDESGKSGWGAEGERVRIAPGVDLTARGLTGACLAVARTLQENGAYLGDNSGSSTQIKASQAGAYLGTNLSTDCMQGKVSFDDFEAVKAGWAG
jgi:hypothetical protein